MRTVGAVSVRQLHSYVAVACLGSMSDAAEALHCSLSTVSSHLASLERFVGEPLLVRTRNGWRTTPSGRRVFDAANAALCAFLDLSAPKSREGGRGSPEVVRKP